MMFWVRRYVSLVMLWCVSMAALAASYPWPGFLRHAVHDSGLPQSAFGMYVYDLTTQRPVFVYQASRPFHPASVMKLMTFSAAYALLGYAYQWPTEVFLDPQQSAANGVYHGNVYLRMHANPQWMFSDLLIIAETLRDAGIRVIDGDIVVDAHEMDWLYAELSSHRRGDPVDRPYNVAPNPLLLNYRMLQFQLLPQGQAGVDIEPTTILPHGCPILNHMTQSSSVRNCRAMISLDHTMSGVCSISFTGQLAPFCFHRPDPWYVYVSWWNHEDFFRRSFLRIWQDNLHGIWHGHLRYGTVPAAHRLLLHTASAPLYAIAHDALKFSNNVMAQSVFLTLSQHNTAGPYAQRMTFSHSRLVLGHWLTQHNLCAYHDYAVMNGSGFAYHSWLTPRCVFHVLQYDFHQPYFDLLRDNLPVVGVDGTMATRLTTESIAGHAWVKTGTMKTVRGIAGYVYARDGHVYVVVAFVNDGHDATPGVQVADQLLMQVYHAGAAAFAQRSGRRSRADT